MIPHVDFATGLVRLSRCRIGTAEAATLFVIAHGAPTEKIAKILKISKAMARGRCGILKSKKLAEAIPLSGGGSGYRATDRGRELIAQVLGMPDEQAL